MKSGIRALRRALLVVSGAGFFAGYLAGIAGAQVKPPPKPDTLRRDTTVSMPIPAPPAKRDTSRAPGDTLDADSLKKKRIEVAWDPPDSVMSALLLREGYAVTRYQGNRVIFKAREHTMNLIGKRAAVERDSSTLIGDTIVFNDSTNIILATGDTLVLRDPSQGEDDIVALGLIRYDVTNRRGVVRNVTTAVESGQRWIVHGRVAAFQGDTTSGGSTAFYAVDGYLTSCDHLDPHYHFAAKEMKLISKNVMVARPAILYIADVPVMWLPFVFQDMRSGRRSGLIPPRIGFNQVFRQSPFLRRSVEDIGYYFALSDYTDATISLDWRSNARSTETDPGYLKFNGVLNYRWRDRFIDGSLAASQHYLRNGETNQAYTLVHSQRFSQRTSLSANLNYVTNTVIQRNTTFNPYQALQPVTATLNFSTGRGPFSINVGGTQKQYLGRDQLDRDFPSLGITSKPIQMGNAVTWTPSLRITNSERFNIDQAGEFPFRYFNKPDGGLDSTRTKQDTRNSSISFDTPLQIFGFNLRNSFVVNDVLVDFPQRGDVYTDIRDTTTKQERIFARSYKTGIDWETGFNLPSFFQGSWNISPSVSFQKVDGRSPLIVRTERSGGKFVAQSLRPSYGLSMSPKLYGFFPGFGPLARIRHSVEPTFGYSYTPSGNVSDEFLAANGDRATGYLGNNPQNTLSFGLSTNFEGKLKAVEGDSAAGPEGEGGQKIKLLSMTFTSLSYDFIRAQRSTGGTGLTNQSFGYSARSDLLPGLEFGVDYSLFQGDPISDSAVFKPYRTGLRSSLSLDQNSPLVRGLGRLLGIRTLDEREQAPAARPGQPVDDRQRAGGLGGSGVAGRPITGSINSAAMQVPAGQGWKMNLAYSAQRQRPPVGSGVRDLDPAVECLPFLSNPFLHQECVTKQRTSGEVGQQPWETTTRGGTFYRSPPQSNIQGGLSFHVTDKWAAQWQTTYDLTENAFASQIVSLQRELHDWDAVFAFTRSPNGNFAFNFFIALKAQPELRLPYDRQSFPRGYTGQRQ